MLDAVQLLRHARDGALLLTPNVRSARQVRARLLQSATDPGEAALLTERVLPWRAWTARLWQQSLVEGREERLLLQPLQERLLWEQVLDTDRDVEQTDALLTLCQTAAALLHRHGAANPAHLVGPGQDGTDAGSFARWFQTFEHWCAQEELLPAAALESALAAHAFPVPEKRIVLCGLTDLVPAQQKLLAMLTDHGTTVVAAASVTSPAAVTMLRCPDERSELESLAQHLAHALASPTRPALAVVVPDLSTARDRIDRVLREHLQAEDAACISAENRHPLWEFSTGRPLAATALIATALTVLTWTVRDLEGEELSVVLRSPHLSWPVDAETAASLDAGLLRRTPHLSWTWSAREVARLLGKTNAVLASAVADRSRAWPALRHTTSGFGDSAERARQILRDFGWLQSGERTSAEFQAAKRFNDLLDDLAALDQVAGAPPSWPDFVHRLIASCRAISFAPENTGAPIQVITPDESSGIEADELWMLHADESRWSGQALPHPLLSLTLQRRHGMPGVEPGHDQLRHREQTERIARIAPAATFSFAESNEAGEQRPSAAVLALPSLQHQEKSSAGILTQIHASTPLQAFDDGDLIPIRMRDDMGPISGGVSTLQSQAACAFRAFAERRLGSATLDSLDLGMDARDRGSLLHNALQIFWQQTQNSDTLHELIGGDRLDAEIQRAIDLALSAERNPGDRWSESYLDIQRVRLERLLHRWLTMEAQRPRFEIAYLERDVNVTVAGVPLKVRVDRVDRVTLPDGSSAYVMVDYKTGDPSASKWEGDRPDEPQLPLYATAAMAELADTAETPVGAIAFGVVRAGDKLNFISAPRKTAWLFSGDKANSASLDFELEAWRNTLENLAHEFSSGIATVGPKEYPATCHFCDQRLLCRLNPSLLEAEESEVEA